MSNLSDKEIELIEILKRKNPYEGYIVGLMLTVKENGNIDKVLKYVKDNPEARTDKILGFALDN